MIAKARLRYLRSSAQKTRLVVDQIRGLGVNQALGTLRESPKSVSRDVEKVLRSAVANAAKGDQRVDADTLYVSRAFVDGGPVLKRVRPATFGRAFRILHRMCHITVELDAIPGAVPRVARAKRRAQEAKAARGLAPSPPAPEAEAKPQKKARATRKRGKGSADAAAPAEKD